MINLVNNLLQYFSDNPGSILSLIALMISSSALLTAILNFRRKSKVRIRGTYILSSSVDCDEKYVSKIVLENTKDRSVTIFGVYLKIYPNYYIELETFEDNPMIIKAFETINRDYGPIQYYGVNLNKIKMRHLFEGNGRKPKHKTRIVLSTSDGKYVVKKYIRHWIPILESFKNHMTGWVIPYTVKFKDRYVGSNIRYVVLINYKGSEQTIHIREKDYEVMIFRNFILTRESLASKEALYDYLDQMMKLGKLLCDSFEVFDTNDWDKEERKTFDAPVLNWFQYHVLARIQTMLSDVKIKIRNKKTIKKKA